MATATALGLWEPAKHSSPVTFALQPSATAFSASPPTIYDSCHNPVNLGRPAPLRPLLDKTNVPEGFVKIHIGQAKNNTDKPDKSYTVNRQLLGEHCGQFSQERQIDDSINSFTLVPPAQDVFSINEDALELLFPIFNNWLHGGAPLVTNDGTPARHLGLLTLCRLYVFGILLQAPAFSNAVADAIKRKRQCVSVFEYTALQDAVMYAYGLPYMCLRAAVVESVVVNSGPWIVAAFEWPSIAKKDMLDALFCGYRERLEMGVVGDGCRHHVHEEGETCLSG